VHADEIAPHPELMERLMSLLRALFFAGRRDIPMSPRQREALLRDGLPGLAATSDDNVGAGTWAYYDRRAQEEELGRVHFGGGLPARGLFAFADFVRGSGRRDGRDAQIGSIGGGNHFVELQRIDHISDGATAHAFGLERDRLAIMAHSGSVGLGHAVGGHFHDRARALHPRQLPQPAHGFYVLPTHGPHAREAAAYLDAMRNAANFAFGNRLFLGLVCVRALSEILGRRVGARLVYDLPHNLIWQESDGETFIHRKGACPALGPEPERDSPFRYTGQPVIIPGSMGAHSYVLAGAGNRAALQSACHGAGRVLSRGESRHVDEATYAGSVGKLRVVTPIDPRAYEVRSRRDVLAKYHERLREEAPYAYKSIAPVIETVEEAGIARGVARLWPILTVKG
jgi:tRNA-splicing ligase RtcB